MFLENQFNLVDFSMLSKKNVTIWPILKTPKLDIEEKSYYIVNTMGFSARGNHL